MEIQPVPADALPFGLFEKAVETLVARGGEKVALLTLSRAEVSLNVKRGLGTVRVTLLRHDASSAENMKNHISALIANAKALPLDIVLVGGDKSARGLLKRPFFTSSRVGFVHLADGMESFNSKSLVAHDLLRAIEDTPSDAASWAQLAAHTSQGRAQILEDAEELAAFGATIAARKPFVTYGVAAVILAVFALQLFTGAASSLVVLSRLGALVPTRISEGEVWRLISCTFLHGGWMHVLLNVYVLIILGTFLEKIIGSARFLLLYALAALGGSLGSWVFLKATLSVGASGAVWGLLGAHAILAYRSQGLLPQALVAGARKAAMINLGINVLNSFSPNIDMWAHFAGGAVGMALFASGLLTRGLPRLGEVEQLPPEQRADISRAVPTPAAMWIAGGLGGLLLIAGLGVGLVAGRPLDLRNGGSMARVQLPRLGVSLVLPTGQRRKVIESQAGPELMFGDPLSDPMTVVLFSKRLPTPLDAANIERELELLKKGLPTPPKTKPLQGARMFTIGGFRGVTASYRYPSGLVLERAFLLRPAMLVRAEVLRWPGFPRMPHGGSGEKLLGTVKVL